MHKILTHPAPHTAILAGGCFWCVQAIFERVVGVTQTKAGYVWMKHGLPAKEDRAHAGSSRMEAVSVEWDEAQIDLGSLLDIFYATSSPSLVDWSNPQGFDHVRSAVFLDNEAHIEQAHTHQDRKRCDNIIHTQILGLVDFEVAAPSEQNFYQNNPKDGFCTSIIEPKLTKLFHTFPQHI